MIPRPDPDDVDQLDPWPDKVREHFKRRAMSPLEWAKDRFDKLREAITQSTAPGATEPLPQPSCFDAIALQEIDRLAESEFERNDKRKKKRNDRAAKIAEELADAEGETLNQKIATLEADHDGEPGYSRANLYRISKLIRDDHTRT